jgi:hypothetical protein
LQQEPKCKRWPVWSELDFFLETEGKGSRKAGGGGGGGREGKTGGVQRFFGAPMNNYPRVFNPLSIVFLQVKA